MINDLIRQYTSEWSKLIIIFVVVTSQFLDIDVAMGRFMQGFALFRELQLSCGVHQALICELLRISLFKGFSFCGCSVLFLSDDLSSNTGKQCGLTVSGLFAGR